MMSLDLEHLFLQIPQIFPTCPDPPGTRRTRRTRRQPGTGDRGLPRPHFGDRALRRRARALKTLPGDLVNAQ